MFKKIVSLVVLMALVLTAAAFAANSPAWPTAPVAATASSGTVTVSPLTDAAKAVVDAIKDKSAADVLSDEAKLAAIAAGTVPADIDFAAYKLDRVFSLAIADAEAADLTVAFPIVPAYAADAKLLGAVGIIENGAASWTAVSAKVNSDNAVESVIPAATVDAVQNGSGEAVYAVFKG